MIPDTKAPDITSRIDVNSFRVFRRRVIRCAHYSARARVYHGFGMRGAWLGAGVVAGWPRRNVQIGMGIALLLAAVMTLLQVLQVTTGAGESLQLTDTRLALDLSEILPSAL